MKQQSKIWALVALFILNGSFCVLSAQPVSRSAAIDKAQQLLQSKGLTFNREKSMKLADNYSDEEPIEFTSRLKVQNGSLHELLVKMAVPKDPKTGILNYDGAVSASYDMYYGEKGDEFDINFSFPAGKLPVGTYAMCVYKEISHTYVPLFDINVKDTATEVVDVRGKKEDARGDWFTIQGIKLNARPTEKGLYIKDRQVIAVP